MSSSDEKKEKRRDALAVSPPVSRERTPARLEVKLNRELYLPGRRKVVVPDAGEAKVRGVPKAVMKDGADNVPAAPPE